MASGKSPGPRRGFFSAYGRQRHQVTYQARAVYHLPPCVGSWELRKADAPAPKEGFRFLGTASTSRPLPHGRLAIHRAAELSSPPMPCIAGPDSIPAPGGRDGAPPKEQQAGLSYALLADDQLDNVSSAPRFRRKRNPTAGNGVEALSPPNISPLKGAMAKDPEQLEEQFQNWRQG
jgi:hypothetical protein